MRLNVDDHDRSAAGLRYVYAVASRRSGGVSVGVNLNTNRACNWRCVYCQVPGLVRGAAPSADLAELERELALMLDRALDPAWLARHAPEGARRLNDVAFSGDGEPTSSPHIVEAIEIAGRTLDARGAAGAVKLVLITNGSLVHTPRVRRALERLAALGGEAWIKLDSATDAGTLRLNDNPAGAARSLENVEIAARACPTWIQTIAFDWHGPTLAGAELERYCDRLADLVARGVPLRGVLLYGLARPSRQPEAKELRPLAESDLRAIAARIERCGVTVRVHP
jgi:pyruvate-formate lyase-activating enzyme